MNGHALHRLAEAWATVTHDGRSRRDAGEPYINHCERVAGRVQGWRRKTLAWLHDTVEDASDPVAMEEALRAVFPMDIVDDVIALSRLPDDHGMKPTYRNWIEDMAARAGPDVIAVKLADIEDNLATVGDIPNGDGLETRYLRAKAVLLETT